MSRVFTFRILANSGVRGACRRAVRVRAVDREPGRVTCGAQGAYHGEGTVVIVVREQDGEAFRGSILRS